MILYHIAAKIKEEPHEIKIEALKPEDALNTALDKAVAQLNVDRSDITDIKTTEIAEVKWFTFDGQEISDDFTHTVYCFSDNDQTAHFINQAAAVAYANKLLLQKLQCKIYPYRKTKRHIDYVAERGPNG